METDDPGPVERWRERLSDLVSFEVYPVNGSAQAAARVDVARPPDR
jgi:hypothetical protein